MDDIDERERNPPPPRPVRGRKPKKQPTEAAKEQMSPSRPLRRSQRNKDSRSIHEQVTSPSEGMDVDAEVDTTPHTMDSPLCAVDPTDSPLCAVDPTDSPLCTVDPTDSPPRAATPRSPIQDDDLAASLAISTDDQTTWEAPGTARPAAGIDEAEPAASGGSSDMSHFQNQVPLDSDMSNLHLSNSYPSSLVTNVPIQGGCGSLASAICQDHPGFAAPVPAEFECRPAFPEQPSPQFSLAPWPIDTSIRAETVRYEPQSDLLGMSFRFINLCNMIRRRQETQAETLPHGTEYYTPAMTPSAIAA